MPPGLSAKLTGRNSCVGQGRSSGAAVDVAGKAPDVAVVVTVGVADGRGVGVGAGSGVPVGVGLASAGAGTMS